MMKVKHSFLVFAAAFLMVMPAFAKTGVVYQRQDSLRIVSLLQQAKAMKKKPANWMMWFGKQFVGIPYVADLGQNTGRAARGEYQGAGLYYLRGNRDCPDDVCQASGNQFCSFL